MCERDYRLYDLFLPSLRCFFHFILATLTFFQFHHYNTYEKCCDRGERDQPCYLSIAERNTQHDNEVQYKCNQCDGYHSHNQTRTHTYTPHTH